MVSSAVLNRSSDKGQCKFFVDNTYQIKNIFFSFSYHGFNLSYYQMLFLCLFGCFLSENCMNGFSAVELTLHSWDKPIF